MITLVLLPEQVQQTACLAKKIWTEHYTPIIGTSQVDYMIDKFQSEEAIQNQIDEGYFYYLLTYEGESCGYLSLKKESDTTLFLSKIYVLSSIRGKGLGKELVKHAFQIGRELNTQQIRLTVNKHNTSSIVAYEKMGFKRTRALIAPIGNGFVMDDYEYTISIQ